METQTGSPSELLHKANETRKWLFHDKATTTRTVLRATGSALILGGLGYFVDTYAKEFPGYVTQQQRQDIKNTLQWVEADLVYTPATKDHGAVFPNGVKAIEGIEQVLPDIATFVTISNKPVEEPTVHRPLRTAFNALPYEPKITRIKGKPISEAAIKPYWRLVNQAEKNVDGLSKLPAVTAYNENQKDAGKGLGVLAVGVLFIAAGEFHREWNRIRPVMRRKKTWAAKSK